METHGDTISMTVDGYGLGHALVFASGPYYHLMGVPRIILIHSGLFLDNQRQPGSWVTGASRWSPPKKHLQKVQKKIRGINGQYKTSPE